MYKKIHAFWVHLWCDVRLKSFKKKLVFHIRSLFFACSSFSSSCICVYNKRLPWNDNKILFGGRERTRNLFLDRVAINSCIWCFPNNILISFTTHNEMCWRVYWIYWVISSPSRPYSLFSLRSSIAIYPWNIQNFMPKKYTTELLKPFSQSHHALTPSLLVVEEHKVFT